MKQLSLNAWERVQLAACVPERGSLHDYRMYVRLLDVLELSQEERERIGWKETLVLQDGEPVINPQTGLPVVSITVQQPELEFELAFEDADFDNLMALVDKRETWAIRGPDRQRTKALLDKLDKAKET